MKKAMLAALALLVLWGPALALGSTIRISGSTTVMPLAEKLAKLYQARHPEVGILVSGGGSGAGIKSLMDGSVDIADASRFLKDKEVALGAEKGVFAVPFAIAHDCIVPVVHPQNPIRDFTVSQLKEIYQGRIRNWRELGGRDLPIVLLSRDTSSGTYEVWEQKVMEKGAISPSAELIRDNASMVREVARNPGALGYCGLGFVNETVRPVPVNGVAAGMENARNGSYLLSRPLFMFTNGWPTGEVMDFLNFARNPGAGQRAVAEAGYIALFEASGPAARMASAKPAREKARPAGEAFSPSPALSRKWLRSMQMNLAAMGYAPGPSDGLDGPRTRSAAASFARSQGLEEDMGALARELSGMVRKVQEKLAAQGYDPGPADGVAGSRTREALRSFCRDRSLSGSGISPGVLSLLGV